MFPSRTSFQLRQHLTLSKPLVSWVEVLLSYSYYRCPILSWPSTLGCCRLVHPYAIPSPLCTLLLLILLAYTPAQDQQEYLPPAHWNSVLPWCGWLPADATAIQIISTYCHDSLWMSAPRGNTGIFIRPQKFEKNGIGIPHPNGTDRRNIPCTCQWVLLPEKSCIYSFFFFFF